MNLNQLNEKRKQYSQSGDEQGWLVFEHKLWAKGRHPVRLFKPKGEHFHAVIEDTKIKMGMMKWI